MGLLGANPLGNIGTARRSNMLSPVNSMQQPMQLPVDLGADPNAPVNTQVSLPQSSASSALLNAGLAILAENNKEGGDLGSALVSGLGMYRQTKADEEEAARLRRRDQLAEYEILGRIRERQIAEQEKIRTIEMQDAVAARLPENERAIFMLNPDLYLQQRANQRNAAVALQMKTDAEKRDMENKVNMLVSSGVDRNTALQSVLGYTTPEPIERKIVEQDGVQYYADTGQPVIAEPLKPIGAPDTEKVSAIENELRDEYTKMSNDFIITQTSFDKIKLAAESASPAGDISLVYSFMKMQDPGSTVREGEFATAGNAGGIPERVRAMYNKAITGELLSPNVRQDFVNQSFKIYKNANERQKTNKQKYDELAQRNAVNPLNVTGIFEIPEIAEGSVAQPKTQEEYNLLKSGDLYIDPQDGKTKRKK